MYNKTAHTVSTWTCTFKTKIKNFQMGYISYTSLLKTLSPNGSCVRSIFSIGRNTPSSYTQSIGSIRAHFPQDYTQYERRSWHTIRLLSRNKLSEVTSPTCRSAFSHLYSFNRLTLMY